MIEWKLKGIDGECKRVEVVGKYRMGNVDTIYPPSERYRSTERHQVAQHMVICLCLCSVFNDMSCNTADADLSLTVQCYLQ